MTCCIHAHLPFVVDIGELSKHVDSGLSAQEAEGYIFGSPRGKSLFALSFSHLFPFDMPPKIDPSSIILTPQDLAKLSKKELAKHVSILQEIEQKAGQEI